MPLCSEHVIIWTSAAPASAPKLRRASSALNAQILALHRLRTALIPQQMHNTLQPEHTHTAVSSERSGCKLGTCRTLIEWEAGMMNGSSAVTPLFGTGASSTTGHKGRQIVELLGTWRKRSGSRPGPGETGQRSERRNQPQCQLARYSSILNGLRGGE